MTKFVASVMMTISNAMTAREAVIKARENMRAAHDEMVVIIRDNEYGVVTTYDPVGDTWEFHDLNGNGITEADANRKAMRLL